MFIIISTLITFVIINIILTIFFFVQRIHKALAQNNWDLDEAEKALHYVEPVVVKPAGSPLKRKHNTAGHKKAKKAKTKDYDEDNDVESDEISYHEKIYDRFHILFC